MAFLLTFQIFSLPVLASEAQTQEPSSLPSETAAETVPAVTTEPRGETGSGATDPAPAESDSYSGEEISGYCYGEYLTFEEPGEPQVQLDIAAYYQTDSQWAEEKIGSTKKTIGAIGCTTTCMAMSESYLTRTEILPNEMEDQLWYDENGDMGWPDTYTWTTDETHYLEVIFGKLHEGIPVLVGAERHNGRPHWVLVTGYQGDASEFTEEDFIINDPLTSYRTTLQQFFDEYPEFYKIAYYTG